MCRSVKFLNQAAEEAERSELEIKHGALLVRSGKVIGSGHNSSRTRVSSVSGTFSGVSMHSEVAALHSAVPYLL
jgi:tRNA(Arg) A34 adenosine deaminase TadA